MWDKSLLYFRNPQNTVFVTSIIWVWAPVILFIILISPLLFLAELASITYSLTVLSPPARKQNPEWRFLLTSKEHINQMAGMISSNVPHYDKLTNCLQRGARAALQQTLHTWTTKCQWSWNCLDLCFIRAGNTHKWVSCSCQLLIS